MDFATQLKTMRQARGLTQEQLADNCGIPNTYISLMETGKMVPAGEWARVLREALGWTPETDELLVLLHHTSLAMTERYAAAIQEQPVCPPA